MVSVNCQTMCGSVIDAKGPQDNNEPQHRPPGHLHQYLNNDADLKPGKKAFISCPLQLRHDAVKIRFFWWWSSTLAYALTLD